MKSHYRPSPRTDRSANTAWAQSLEAKELRMLAVSVMQDVLDAWPTNAPDRRLDVSPEMWRQWGHIVRPLESEVVSLLQEAGLVSRYTAAIDVDVFRIISDARAYLREKDRSERELEDLLAELKLDADE